MTIKGKLTGNYGLATVLELEGLMRNHMQEWIVGGKTLVIGTQSPWIEAMLLELGAANVTTLEYNHIESRVDNLNVMTPEALRGLWKSSKEKLNFDAVVSFSSIEHSGLGRYGDALNPWGDLIAAAQAW